MLELKQTVNVQLSSDQLAVLIKHYQEIGNLLKAIESYRLKLNSVRSEQGQQYIDQKALF